jgi:hypothetical protein
MFVEYEKKVCFRLNFTLYFGQELTMLSIPRTTAPWRLVRPAPDGGAPPPRLPRAVSTLQHPPHPGDPLNLSTFELLVLAWRRAQFPFIQLHIILHSRLI